MVNQVIESDCGNVTTLAGDDVKDEIIVTESAKLKISDVLKDETDESFLRVGVSGGGCSGFQYVFGIHDEIEDGDIINDWGDGKVVVDEMSIRFMKGATLNYIKELSGEYFSVSNPEATSQCGCNKSFSYDPDID